MDREVDAACVFPSSSTIWSCWFQGEEDASLPYVNRVCLSLWRQLNPDRQFIVIDDQNIDFYAPDYRRLLSQIRHERSFAAKSDLLRLLLLQRHGGVWVDSTLLPMFPLDFFLPQLLNSSGFFSYRFIPRLCHVAFAGDRETVSWFLAVNTASHPLITAWLERFTHYFLTSEDDRFFAIHHCLTELYDSNHDIRTVLGKMPQICERIPHCLTNNSLKRIVDSEEARRLADQNLETLFQAPQRTRLYYSFLYKRPLYADLLSRVALAWTSDLLANRTIAPLSVEDAGGFPIQPMLTPMRGRGREAVLDACQLGLCFYDSKLPHLDVNI